MTEKRSKIKRFFKSHILRILLAGIILFSTAFFPLLFIYPLVPDYTGVVVVVVIFSCLFELIAFVLISHYCVYSKVDAASKHLTDMAKNSANPQKFSDLAIDNSVTDIIDATNITSEEYNRLDQVRKTFVANASHELRTPLTSIQGFLQAVLDGTASDENREKYLQIALGETKRLNALINSMLDLSRLDSGKNPLVMSKFDVNDMIREIAARLEPSLINKALQINVDFARNSFYVYADKDKIYQVIINLVDNAIKYSPAYSRIIITTSLHDDKVYVTVRDFGYGISKKDQMLIWDTFYMTDKSRSLVKTKGTGLGLSIVKKIINDHGEVIWVESSRGAGATFIFTLTLFDATKHNENKGKVLKESDGDKASAETEK